MIKKKLGILALALAVASANAAGCNSVKTESDSEESASVSENNYDTPSTGKLSVVCTIFPEYDWVKEIVGDHSDNVEVTYLLDSGVEQMTFLKLQPAICSYM